MFMLLDSNLTTTLYKFTYLLTYYKQYCRPHVLDYVISQFSVFCAQCNTVISIIFIAASDRAVPSAPVTKSHSGARVLIWWRAYLASKTLMLVK